MPTAPPRSRRALTTALALAATLALPALAGAQPLPLTIETAALPNGLRVVLAPDHAMPSIAVLVAYDVGSRVEDAGRSGFAHLFEHLMFEGTPNVPHGEFDRLVARYGARANATTSEDRTTYFETVPTHALEMGLWLEADRMRALDVSAAALAVQRETVLEERRQAYENTPYALSELRRDELAYGAYYPYAHSVIGDPDDLRRAPLADVRAFHARYYAPNHAVLALAGDFDPATALALVRRHFGSIPASTAPVWQPPAFTAPATERVDSVRDAFAELPGFHLAYHIPPRRTPDHYALDLLANVLARGESARLYRELVRTRQVAAEVTLETLDRRGPDLLALWCVVSQGHTVAEVRALVDRALEALARDGVTEAELARAKNQQRTRWLAGLESPVHRAEALAEFALYDGDATLVRTEFERYAGVTRDDVRRVAQQYLARTNRVVLDVLPRDAPAAPARR